MINEYNTVGNRIAPPFTSIVKYDLNVPAIKWRVGFGDDPELAARGVTGTGTPGLLNGVIVTASGLLFGAGRDNADSRVGHRHRRSAVVVAFRRRLHRLAGDVRNGGASVPAGARGEHAAPRRRRRHHGAARLGRVRLAAQVMK